MASRLQEYLLQQPLYAAGQNAAEQGTSMAPVKSPWEGLARALQGGLGGLMQGYAVSQAKGAQRKDNEALAAYMKNPDDPVAAAAAADHPAFATVSLSRMNAKEKLAAAMEARTQQAADKENMIRLTASLRQGHVDPTAAINARADAEMKRDENKARLKAEADNAERAGILKAMGIDTEPSAPPAAAPPVALPPAAVPPANEPRVPAGTLPNSSLPPMRMVPPGAASAPAPVPDRRTELPPAALPPPIDERTGLPVMQGDNPTGEAGQGNTSPVIPPPVVAKPPAAPAMVPYQGQMVHKEDLDKLRILAGSSHVPVATVAEAHRKMLDRANSAARGDQGDYTGNGIDAQVANALARGARDPEFAKTPAYEFAWNHRSKPQQVIDHERGVVVTMPGTDMSNYPRPPGMRDEVPRATPIQGYPQKQPPEAFKTLVGDVGALRSSLDNYEKVFKEVGGGSVNAYLNDPTDPKAQRLIGAFDALKTALRGPAFVNTGVLQPAEMTMLEDMLLSPRSLRGIITSPDALKAKLDEFRTFVDNKLTAASAAHGVETPGMKAPPAQPITMDAIAAERARRQKK
jgi:hypothetical protein